MVAHLNASCDGVSLGRSWTVARGLALVSRAQPAVADDEQHEPDERIDIHERQGRDAPDVDRMPPIRAPPPIPMLNAVVW